MKRLAIKKKEEMPNLRKIVILILFQSAAFGLRTAAAASNSELARGMTAFEERRWREAMESFLDVLRHDPAEAKAHAYIVLIARELEAERQAIVRNHRLELLGAAAQRALDSRQDPTELEQALQETTRSEQLAREAGWHARCEEARLERLGGRLLSANDVILKVLSENSAFPEAQRELSELQSDLRRAIDTDTAPSIVERYAMEGFYAYGQADYAAALTAWAKLRTLIDQKNPGAGLGRTLDDLHVTAYEKIARTQVEEIRRRAELKALFESGAELYRKGRFIRALERFRKVAITDPEYPSLGYYLVQAEAGAERERTARLGVKKQHEIDRLLQAGIVALEGEKFQEAENHFEKILNLDPSHQQASSYLAMVHSEMDKRHNPRGAQMHYEAGLIAYASGKLDEAVREWRMAVRMNPSHEKALHALAKVQKELALNTQELTDAPLP